MQSEVVEAVNGKEALGMFRERPGCYFDLLVTDMVMPDMGGQELAERLTRLEPGLRVLFVSGYTDNPGVRKGVQAQEAHFLPKPFTSASLAKKVRNLFDGRKRSRTPP